MDAGVKQGILDTVDLKGSIELMQLNNNFFFDWFLHKLKLESKFKFVGFTEFDTSKMEMNAVADMFDQNIEGYIDWKEFIAALRPDWEEKQPTTEAEKIHDEVKRLVMLCTCRQKFRVFQVGEGKYRVSRLLLL